MSLRFGSLYPVKILSYFNNRKLTECIKYILNFFTIISFTCKCGLYKRNQLSLQSFFYKFEF